MCNAIEALHAISYVSSFFLALFETIFYNFAWELVALIIILLLAVACLQIQPISILPANARFIPNFVSNTFVTARP